MKGRSFTDDSPIEFEGELQDFSETSQWLEVGSEVCCKKSQPYMSRMCLSTRFKYASINLSSTLPWHTRAKWGFDNVKCQMPLSFLVYAMRFDNFEFLQRQNSTAGQLASNFPALPHYTPGGV